MSASAEIAIGEDDPGLALYFQVEASNLGIDPIFTIDGTFTFSGGTAPMLDTNNRAVLDAGGQPVFVPITSIERYRRTLLFQKLGFSPSQIANLGGGATQFTIVSGDPGLFVRQFDLGTFVSDDWKISRALTLSLGLRYERQTNIRDEHEDQAACKKQSDFVDAKEIEDKDYCAE